MVTKTFEKTGTVWIAPCDAKFPGARPLRLNETMTLAEFGFSIPLGKMGLKLHMTRQLDFPANPVQTDLGPGWEISFNQFENYPRAVDEIAIAEAAKAKKEKAQSRKRRKPQSSGEPLAKA